MTILNEIKTVIAHPSLMLHEFKYVGYAFGALVIFGLTALALFVGPAFIVTHLFDT